MVGEANETRKKFRIEKRHTLPPKIAQHMKHASANDDREKLFMLMRMEALRSFKVRLNKSD